MAGTARGRNAQLAAMIRASGLTYAGVAREVRRVAAENDDRTLRTNASAVAHWTSGTAPSAPTTGYLAEALARRIGRVLSPSDLGLQGGELAEPVTMTGDAVAMLAELGGADVERRAFLSSVVYSLPALALPLRADAAGRAERAATGGKVGTGEVEAVREVTRAFTLSDERLGGGNARSAVVEYLRTDAAAFCRATFATDEERKAMFGAVAELAYLAGWKSHDAGLDGLAQRYYLVAFQLAEESDPAAHASYVLRILAHQAMDLGNYQHCADLAEEALRRIRSRVDAQTESLFWLTAARARAGEGERKAMVQAISRAEQAADRDRADAQPRWAALGGPAQARLANQTGKALVAAGDFGAAERQFSVSARCWNPDTHPRIHALSLADVAETQYAQGKVEQACRTWDNALDHMGGILSARVTRAVRTMRSRVSTLRGVPIAAALNRRAEAVL